MSKITFVEHNGESKTIEAEIGQTLMQVATANGVRGIVAECGGACVCGTCHCFPEAPWQAKAGEPSEDEKMLVEFSEHYQPDKSRLGCQIVVTEDLDGMVVHLPPSQP